MTSHPAPIMPLTRGCDIYSVLSGSVCSSVLAGVCVGNSGLVAVLLDASPLCDSDVILTPACISERHQGEGSVV
jgi:hypothetical protein